MMGRFHDRFPTGLAAGRWRRLGRHVDEAGQGMMEYVVIMSFVVVALVASFTALTGSGVGPLYTTISNTFSSL